jgi:hypothetical protein
MFKVNNVMQNTIKYKAFVLIVAAVAFSGCKKLYNLPDEKNYLSAQADYTTKDFDWILGRTTQKTNIFSSGNSSFPMTFEIKNPRFGDGKDASDMLAVKPTLVWTQEYTGKETSLAQIEAKRHLENHPMLELRGSGDIIFWYTATRDIIKPTDSVVYPQNKRYFDVKIANSGGSRFIRNLAITVKIDVPYFPANDYNQINGKPNTSTPGGSVLVRNYPSRVDGIRNAATNQFMNGQDPNTGLVYLYIRKFVDKPGDVPAPNPAAVGHRLRIKFLDKDSKEIDPHKFNATKWLDQIHGFTPDGTQPGYVITPTYVEYNVAYPIPLATIPSKFTSGGAGNTGGGNTAHAEFSFTRTGFGNVRETGTIYQDFRIFEKGDWEIVFQFATANPKFDND